MLSIYIHIPFCLKKCKYCDFLSFPANEALRNSYLNALCREIASCRYTTDEVGSVYLGGGTPSLLTSADIAKILDKIKTRFNLSRNCEISMECNPATADYEKLLGFRRAGINRLSIGLQSANDDELILLGRVHNYSHFLETYTSARKAGFDNINVDLISAIPGQTILSYKETLTKIVNLGPEHISAYSLIIEENTEFWDIYSDDNSVMCAGCDSFESKATYAKLPDEDTEREMYYLTKSLLKEAGYNRYEISNYSKPSKECRHNLVYWTGGDYISFGLGASSYLDGIRYKNTSDINEYIDVWSGDNKDYLSDFLNSLKKEDGPAYRQYEEAHILSYEEKMEEYMFVGLRLMAGVSKSKFAKLFNKSMMEVYGKEVILLVNQGLLDVKEDIICLTDKGIDVSNYVLSNFLL